MLGDHDTIAAISTAKGVGALSIVRLSGSQTSAILEKCFDKKQKFESHRAYHGLWLNPETSKPVDEVLLLYFSQGRGFTGEESAEVICHGGLKVTEQVLKAMICGGARMARPGEFTYRAVMNERLDLPKAEAILEIIHAQTPRATTQALQNLQGALSKELQDLENGLTFILANLEASIDFTTEDIQPVDNGEMKARAQKLSEKISKLLKTYLPSRAARLGLRTVLAGKPNAGKSSLLNKLLGSNRSIVNENPGTTRDTVEENFILEGNLFNLIDTAGLRQSNDVVEAEGVKRSRSQMASADIIIYVVDSSAGLQNSDVENLRELGFERVILAFNKTDLKTLSVSETLDRFGLNEILCVQISSLSENGIQPLIEALKSLGQQKTLSPEVDSQITTTRQFEGLEKAQNSLSEGIKLLNENASPDLTSFSMREALVQIQNLLGKNAGDDVMDRVFKEFCIGK